MMVGFCVPKNPRNDDRKKNICNLAFHERHLSKGWCLVSNTWKQPCKLPYKELITSQNKLDVLIVSSPPFVA